MANSENKENKFPHPKVSRVVDQISYKGHHILLVNYLPQYVLLHDTTKIEGKAERAFNDLKKAKDFLDKKRKIITLDG